MELVHVWTVSVLFYNLLGKHSGQYLFFLLQLVSTLCHNLVTMYTIKHSPCCLVFRCSSYLMRLFTTPVNCLINVLAKQSHSCHCPIQNGRLVPKLMARCLLF